MTIQNIDEKKSQFLNLKVNKWFYNGCVYFFFFCISVHELD
jgi:hypothetical protein